MADEEQTKSEPTEAEQPSKPPKGTPVGYRAGIELEIMRGPGGVSYSLGEIDGLSKEIVWSKETGMVQYLNAADAKRIAKHLDEGGLASYQRFDFISGENTGIIDPEFLVGQEAIDKHREEFTERYAAYAKEAAKLAQTPSIDVERWQS